MSWFDTNLLYYGTFVNLFLKEIMNKYIADSPCEQCPDRWENFKNLSPEELKLISNHRYETNFKAGEVIFKKGAPVSSAIFLTSGMAKIFLDGMGGKNLLLSIALPGVLIAGPGTYVDSRHHYNLTALTDVKACFIDMSVFKQLVHQNSKFAEGWLMDISQKSLAMHYRMVSLTQKKMPGRLAEALLFFANEIYHADEFELVLTRQEIGDFTNMAKESVIRILKEFEDDEVVKANCPRIKILNKEKLQMISNNG